MHFTLVQLQYIVAVDTYGSFGKAAEASFVTQPSLSMQVKKLEEQLEVILFDRTKKPVMATAIGKEIIGQARKILNEASRMQNVLDQHRGEVEGELKVGIIPTVAPYLLPLFLPEFKGAFSSVHLDIREMITDDILGDLGKGLMDVGILATPLQNLGQYSSEVLYYEEMMVYHSEGHPFSAKKDIRVEEIETDDLMLLNEGHCFREQVIHLCGNFRARDNRQYNFQSGSFETIRGILEVNQGVTLLPELAAQRLDEKRLRNLKRFRDRRPVREVSLIYRKNFYKSRLIEQLANVIRQSVLPHLRSTEGKREVVPVDV